MCDEVKERADQFAERVKAVTGKKPVVFDDTDTMLATVDLDGADICTSHAHHHINALKCLNNGSERHRRETDGCYRQSDTCDYECRKSQ